MKKLIQTLTLAGLLGASIGLAGCGNNSNRNVEAEETEIKVSEARQVGSPFSVQYCGMPNSNVFSLSWAGGVGGFGANLYYPADAKETNFKDHKYKVVSVDSEQIKLRLK